MATELVALGAAGVAGGVLARGGRRLALPTIPSFMVAGILLGPSVSGVISDIHSLELVAAIGLITLLFHLGVEFPLEQVMSSGGRVLATAFGYIGLNVGGGLILGFVLGWGTPEALVVAGAVGISSSAIVTKLLVELRRLANAETPVILGVIVVEDLFLAIYLAVLAPFLGGADTAGEAALQFGVALTFIVGLFVLARHASRLVGLLVDTDDDELLMVLVVGLAVLVAGVAELLGVSDAIGALMIGLVVSRTAVKERVERLILPVRDAFAAIFFVVFGASIQLDALGAIAAPVAAAVGLSLVTNTLGGLLLARIYRLNQRSATNAALALLGRGEFSLILATMAIGAGLDDRIGPFVALYVLILAFVGPLLSARAKRISRAMPSAVLAGYRYVEQETIAEPCDHLAATGTVTPLSEGCEECRETGDDWVHLRVCAECGYVGCCDDSVNRHATGHQESTGHPCIASMEPGEDWRYCYLDRLLVPDPDPPVYRPAPR